MLLEQVHLGLPVALDRAHVLPVAVEAVAEDRAPPSSMAGITLPPKSGRSSSSQCSSARLEKT
jgi:hypothetical protein